MKILLTVGRILASVVGIAVIYALTALLACWIVSLLLFAGLIPAHIILIEMVKLILGTA